jgi:alanine racemase
MALRLTVQRTAWESHVRTVAAAVNGLVPVVKGNGYGFGRSTLHAFASELAAEVCVGTMHELDDVPAGTTAVVLTPSSRPPPEAGVILTVGNEHDVAALGGWRGRVHVKLQSSMRRFGATRGELPGLLAACATAGLEVDGYALHLPLAGTDSDRAAEVEAWLGAIDDRPLSLSHLQPPTFAALQRSHPHHLLRLRLGTALWHGDKSFLHLTADVLAVHPVCSGDRAGYQLGGVPADGQLVMVSAGSAHGVAPLADGRSPFHFARRRLALLEPPHMHTSMLFVPTGDACPAVGDRVDVQRPLIETAVDEIEWQL